MGSNKSKTISNAKSENLVYESFQQDYSEMMEDESSASDNKHLLHFFDKKIKEYQITYTDKKSHSDDEIKNEDWGDS